MLRLTNLANKYKRRTLRALYAQTQAYPYDVQLSAAFVRTTMFDPAGSFVGLEKAAIIPGLVANKLAGEVVTLAGVANDQRPFGLFANYVGGELSDIPSDFDRVGVWRGSGGVFEMLTPSFDDTGLSAIAAAEAGTAVTEAYMSANSVGQPLALAGSYGAAIVAAGLGPPVARLISFLSANAIIVELLV